MHLLKFISTLMFNILYFQSIECLQTKQTFNEYMNLSSYSLVKQEVLLDKLIHDIHGNKRICNVNNGVLFRKHLCFIQLLSFISLETNLLFDLKNIRSKHALFIIDTLLTINKWIRHGNITCIHHESHKSHVSINIIQSI